MLYFSLFLAGFTLGVFAALKIFAPERREETWDPQHLPANALHRQVQAGFPISLKDKLTNPSTLSDPTGEIRLTRTVSSKLLPPLDTSSVVKISK